MAVYVANESGVEVDEQSLAALCRHMLDQLGVDPLAELSVLLVEPDAMAELHLQWLGEPGPTDVMAFPMDELDASSPSMDDSDEPALLGDVVLCPVVATSQAAEQQATKPGWTPLDEMHLLTTHGILHLLGYDHGEPEEQAEMFGRQGELLATWYALTGRT